MALVAIPNFSCGKDEVVVAALVETVRRAGSSVLDVHSDPDHERSVMTVSGASDEVVSSMVALAEAAAERIDLTRVRGVHPRLGALDVCPFVPLAASMDQAVAAAREAGKRIGEELGIPVYLYGEAAQNRSLSLPELRRGGLEELARLASGELRPDHGPTTFSPSHGVVCVGARDVLIAFNVWIDAPVEVAREVATSVRTSSGGLPGVRALGLWLESHGLSQVSMNLVDPAVTGIDDAFDAVVREARSREVAVVASEIVGLVPERFLPSPDAQAARLLRKPGRSLESALRG